MGVKNNIQLINVIKCTHYMFIPFSKINKLEKKHVLTKYQNSVVVI